MTFEEWEAKTDIFMGTMERQFAEMAFNAGAASRDAEIAELVAALEHFYNAWAAGRNSVDVAAIRIAKEALVKVRKP